MFSALLGSAKDLFFIFLVEFLWNELPVIFISRLSRITRKIMDQLQQYAFFCVLPFEDVQLEFAETCPLKHARVRGGTGNEPRNKFPVAVGLNRIIWYHILVRLDVGMLHVFGKEPKKKSTVIWVPISFNFIIFDHSKYNKMYFKILFLRSSRIILGEKCCFTFYPQ
jgi:hypothetical protein